MPMSGSSTTSAPYERATDAEASVLALSTTTTRSAGCVCTASAARHASRKSASSRHGITTVTRGEKDTLATLLRGAPRAASQHHDEQDERRDLQHRDDRDEHADVAVQRSRDHGAEQRAHPLEDGEPAVGGSALATGHEVCDERLDRGVLHARRGTPEEHAHDHDRDGRAEDEPRHED